jgi:hypothetical protein
VRLVIVVVGRSLVVVLILMTGCKRGEGGGHERDHQDRVGDARFERADVQENLPPEALKPEWECCLDKRLLLQNWQQAHAAD